MYSINKDNIIIRTMLVSDVSDYIARFNYPIEMRKILYTNVKRTIKERKDDDSNLYFTILKDGKIIGGIAAIAVEDSPCDAVIQIDLPGCEYLMDKIKKMFIALGRETYFYDDIYFPKGTNVYGNPILGKPIPISVKARWE